MKELISQFSQHLADALDRATSTALQKPQREIRAVIITGLGGSGIGGSIVSELAAASARCPVLVNKNYHLPGFVGPHSLVIACSYSGNTEETLSATRQALEAGAEVACITSGGQLHEIAQKHELNVLRMEGGNPPRSMLAYPLIYLSLLLEHYGIADLQTHTRAEEAIKLLNDEEAAIIQKAREMARKLEGKTAVLYAVSGSLGLASRWRQQLNENAKMLAWEAEIPEMNHNELVGWEGGDPRFVPLFLRHKSDFDRSQKRIEIIKEIMAQRTDRVLEAWSKGSSALARSLYLIHLGDWVSYFLSEMNQVDIMDIKSIDHLKSELSKLPQ